MDPINYTGQLILPNPLQTIMQGLQVGNQLRQTDISAQNAQLAQQQYADQQASIAAQQAQLQAKAQAEADRQAELQAIEQRIGNGQANSADYLRYGQLGDEKGWTAAQNALAQSDKAQQKTLLQSLVPGFTALDSGEPKIAADTLRQSAAAFGNSGDALHANMFNLLADQIEKNPTNAKIQIGKMIPMFEGGKDVLQSALDFNADKRAQDMLAGQLRGQELDNLLKEQELAAAKLKATLPKVVDLSNTAETAAINATKEAVTDKLFVKRYDNLAQKLETATKATGFVGSMAEFLKKNAGLQDQISLMLADYNNVVNSDLLTKLPPGAASDRDIELVRQGYPSDQASPQLLASFVRGLSKVRQYTSETNDALAQWTYQNGTLGPAMGKLKVLGKDVPAGTNYSDFVANNVVLGNPGNAPAKPGAASGSTASDGFSVAVGGQTFSFPTQAALDAFKAKAGIQ